MCWRRGKRRFHCLSRSTRHRPTSTAASTASTTVRWAFVWCRWSITFIRFLKQHRSASEHWRQSLTYMFVFTMSTTCRTAIAWFFDMCCSTSVTLKINANATHACPTWDLLPLKNWPVYVSLLALNEEKEKAFKQSKTLEEQLNHDHATILLERSSTKAETRYYSQRYSSSYPI